jgi:hypothetical protein
MTYTVTLIIDVHDPAELFDAALIHAMQDGLEQDYATGFLRPEGEFNVGACLQMLLDPGKLPGCDILGSESDKVWAGPPEVEMLPIGPRFVVDGHEFANEDSEMLGDGQFAPFQIFDVQEQHNRPTEYATREEAQAIADAYNADPSAALGGQEG